MLDKFKLIKSTFLYWIVSIAGRLMGIPKNIIIGKILLPADFGLYNSVYLWFSYLTLINIGLCAAASRESAHFFGQKEQWRRGVEIQNKAISFDSIILFIVTLSFIGSSSLQKDTWPLISFFFMVGIIYFLNQINSYYERFNSARNRFPDIAKALLLRDMVASLFIIATIYYLKIYALFIGPIIALIAILLYYRARMPLNFRFNFDRIKMGHFFYAGLFFGISSLMSNLFYILDRTFIKLYLDNTIMGLYSFSLIFIMMIQGFLASFQGIFIDILNKDNDNSGCEETIEKVMSYDRYLLLLISFIIIIAQFCYYVLVEYFVVNYRESISIFSILSNMLFFYAVYVMYSPIMASKLMRKEKLLAFIMLAGVISGIIFNAVFIHLGWKGEGIALATVLSQGVITAVTMLSIMKYSSVLNLKRLFKNYAAFLIIISAYTICFYYIVAHHYSIEKVVICSSLFMTILLALAHFYYQISPLKILLKSYKGIAQA